MSCSRVEKLKPLIKEHIEEARYGMFNTHGTLGDTYYSTLYHDDDIEIRIYHDWLYFEVFGLTSDEYRELYDYYTELGGI